MFSRDFKGRTEQGKSFWFFRPKSSSNLKKLKRQE